MQEGEEAPDNPHDVEHRKKLPIVYRFAISLNLTRGVYAFTWI